MVSIGREAPVRNTALRRTCARLGPMDRAAFAETEAGLLKEAEGGPDRAGAAERLAEFYAFLGRNLWCFEFNREPTLSCGVLPFEDWDAFDAFFRSLPEDLSYVELLEKAAARTREAIDLRRKAGARAPEARLWLSLAGLTDLLTDEGEAGPCFEAALKLFEALGDPGGAAESWLGLAHQSRFRTYDPKRTVECLEKARAGFKSAGSFRGQARAAALLAEALGGGDIDRAEALYEEAAELYAKDGDPAAAVDCRAALTRALGGRGLKEREEAAFERNLAFIEANFTGEDLAANYEAAQRFYEERGLEERAAACLEKARAIRRSISGSSS